MKKRLIVIALLSLMALSLALTSCASGAEDAPPIIATINVKAQPTKTTYALNESLNLAGGSITVTYTDNSMEDVSMTDSQVAASGFSSATAGTKAVILTYKERKTAFIVTVQDSIVKLGLAEVITFKMRIIDGTATPAPLTYLDIEYVSGSSDKTFEKHLNMSEDLFALTLFKNDDGKFTGLRCISYEVSGTEVNGLNDATNVWNVYINGAKKAFSDKIAGGDNIVLIYESVGTAANISNVDDTRANKYLFVKNNLVVFRFGMSIAADGKILMPMTQFELTVETETGGVKFTTVVEYVCKWAKLDFNNNEGNICIGDYLGGNVDGSWHFWNVYGSNDKYSGSLGLSDNWGMRFSSGLDYTLKYS